MLDVQYRMHPAIAEYSSSRFYGGLLKTDVRLLSSGYHYRPYHSKTFFSPFVFHDVAYGREKYVNSSVVNSAEVVAPRTTPSRLELYN